MYKRLLIYVFYDTNGILGENDRYLLNSIRDLFSDVCIVVNGLLDDESQSFLNTEGYNFFIRENIGFDFGAYKDFFLKPQSVKWMDKVDQVVLMNSGFYGPIYSFNDIFNMMKDKNIDFWGLTKGEDLKWIDNSVTPDHIQSYFIVINSTMLHDKSFIDYWIGIDYPKTLTECVEKFELSFTKYFSERGYSYTTYIDEIAKGKLKNDGLIYIDYVYELLKYYNFPIIKRKALRVTNFIEAEKALKYVKEHTNYDLGLIANDIKNEKCGGYHNLEEMIIGAKELEQFYYNHNRIYLYGNGKIKKNIEVFFEYRGWKIEGLLLSNPNSTEDAISFERYKAKDDDGVILAMGIIASEEIYPCILKKIKADQVFIFE